MLNKILSTILLSFLIIFSNAQIDTKISISNSTLISSKNQPFWLWANQDGKIKKENHFLNLSEFNGTGIHYGKDSSSFIIAGSTLIAGFGNKKHYFQANELFAGINLKNWEVKAGLWVNEMQLGGLSTSNGNLAFSRNARPYPRINIGISEYKPLPFLGKHVQFKGEFEEGWLNDDRYVSDTHLHHKSFYLKFNFTDRLDLQAGLEHFVMWGGKSANENVGRMPDSFHAYIKYITGQSGDSEFLETDQLNVAGNQYGTYQAKITYNLPDWEIVFNLSHPFDDLSGMNWRNWKDNLLGIYISAEDKNRLISDFIYEYTNTRHQSARSDSLYFWDEKRQGWHREEYDNYFNHGIYRSGVTYKDFAIVSPLFLPIIMEDGVSMGFESTRFIAHHIGAKGKLFPAIHWKGMLTYIQHLGRYRNPYTTEKEQVSGFIQFIYTGDKLPFQVSINLASDRIKGTDNSLGMQIMLTKNFNN